MRTLLFLLLIFAFNMLSAQEKPSSYTVQKENLPDSTIIKADIVNIQYALGRYYKQRQNGFVFTIGGSALCLVSPLALEDPQAQRICAITGGVLTIIGVITTFDAEKWIHKASISISPTGLKVIF